MFSSNKAFHIAVLYTITIGKKAPHVLAGAATTGAYEPAWSPDGKTIAFWSDGSIYTIALGGKPERDHERSEQFEPGLAASAAGVLARTSDRPRRARRVHRAAASSGGSERAAPVAQRACAQDESAGDEHEAQHRAGADTELPQANALPACVGVMICGTAIGRLDSFAVTSIRPMLAIGTSC